MFGFAMNKFHVYPHHTDYLILSHECGWDTVTDGGLNFKEIWLILEDHCIECGKKDN